MSRVVKGSVVGVLGLALLTGLGTFAAWNDSVTVPPGSITSGVLTIDAAGPPAWRDVSAGRPVTEISDIADHRLAPGDTVELTQQLHLNATATNLRAVLSYDAGFPQAVGTAGQEVLDRLEIDLTASGPNISPGGTPDEYAVTPSASQTTVTVIMTVTLPATVAGTDAQDGQVDLSALAFTLQQVTS